MSVRAGANGEYDCGFMLLLLYSGRGGGGWGGGIELMGEVLSVI